MNNQSEYYAVYVLKNKEQLIVDDLKINIRHNILPNKTQLLTNGTIDNSFQIGAYITDVAFPHSWDVTTNRFTSNLSSYIFIEVTYCSTQFFNDVIVPFLKMHSGIIAICGVQIPTPHKRIDRVTGKKVTINIVKPVAIQEYELELLYRSHNSFSAYSDSEYQHKQKLFYWRLNRKGDPVIYPVTFVRYKDDLTIEVKTLDKHEQKLIIPVTQVARNKKIIWRQLGK